MTYLSIKCLDCYVFSERWKTRNLELMMYLKRDAELWTMYNKFEVWSISDTPTLQRIFLVFFLLVLFSVEKDRKYSVLRRVKLFFPDRHFLVKYGICFHRAISPGIWAAKLNCIFTKARKFKKMAADEVLWMTSFMLILAIFLRRRPSFFQRMRSMFLQLRRTRWNVVIRLIIKRCLSPVCVRFFRKGTPLNELTSFCICMGKVPMAR